MFQISLFSLISAKIHADVTMLGIRAFTVIMEAESFSFYFEFVYLWLEKKKTVLDDYIEVVLTGDIFIDSVSFRRLGRVN